jgi:hypothetical protein
MGLFQSLRGIERNPDDGRRSTASVAAAFATFKRRRPTAFAKRSARPRC